MTSGVLQSTDEEGNGPTPRMAGSDEKLVEYPSTLVQVLITTGLLLGIFLVSSAPDFLYTLVTNDDSLIAHDLTIRLALISYVFPVLGTSGKEPKLIVKKSIISTAIPAITAEFNSLSQAGWYGSVFFLTYAAFQSIWGKAYKYFDMKYVFLTAIIIFEVGCLVCALAPNSPALIVGRAIQGSGASGMLLGCYSISNFIAPPERVPIIIGMIGTIFSVASVIGPLLGGVFTSGVTWRWCFYVNLPIGVVPFAFILFFFKTPDHAKISEKVPLREILMSFDPIGGFSFLAALICFFLAMSWGGTEMSWNSSKIIGLLIGWVLLTTVFIVNEVWQGERALLVLRLLKNRHMIVNCTYLFFVYGAYFLVVYNIPTYFQATAGLSPQDSGIRTIPLICAASLLTMAASVAVGKLGYYQPFYIAGSILAAVSGGLIYTFDVDTSLGKQIGYQILLGTAIGLVIQTPAIVTGVVVSDEDKAVALGAVLVTQFYSASLAIAASSAIMNNLLILNVPKYASSVDPAQVLNIGPYDLQSHFSGETLRGIQTAYIVGLRGSWALGIALWGVSFFISFLAKWPGRMESETQTKEATGNISDANDEKPVGSAAA